MKLTTYIQGDDDNQKLFSEIGVFLISKKVHDELGTAITTQNSDTWITATNKSGKCLGFITYRQLKNGIHIRFVYGEDETIHNKLIETVLIKIGSYSVWTNDRKTATIWKEFGFKAKPRATGNFCRWERITNVI